MRPHSPPEDLLLLRRSSLAILMSLGCLVGCAHVPDVASHSVLELHPAEFPKAHAAPPRVAAVGAEGALGVKAEAPPPLEFVTPEGRGALASLMAVDPGELPEEAGVISAALEAAALFTGPTRGPGGFWDELLPPPSKQARGIVARAAQLVGARRLDRSVPNDCSGLVRLAYLQAGIDLVAHGFLAGENAVTGIFRRAQAAGAVHRLNPRPGDLAFFKETYDRNRDGKRNDGMTHIAVVERVDVDGTVTFIHRGGKGVSRSRMNLAFPTVHRQTKGALLNDFIRPASKGLRAYLAGELFVAFASPGGL
ncbi:CHAP domain-containing protein [Corallococcus sp. bb12-1]|uniref:CHAP domain-containing protein n=1 Tax=Corallococcus sp. bb12-1 TaxID=2996784 RepID=UPI00226F48CF|nr:CHAP domain-containing protein [Corallococcus sp. bb12-1]MCY1039859.1 CHAP domain-containing protein [Corallococcus sp. bb12-1]